MREPEYFEGEPRVTELGVVTVGRISAAPRWRRIPLLRMLVRGPRPRRLPGQ